MLRVSYLSLKIEPTFSVSKKIALARSRKLAVVSLGPANDAVLVDINRDIPALFIFQHLLYCGCARHL